MTDEHAHGESIEDTIADAQALEVVKREVSKTDETLDDATLQSVDDSSQ